MLKSFVIKAGHKYAELANVMILGQPIALDGVLDKVVHREFSQIRKNILRNSNLFLHHGGPREAPIEVLLSVSETLNACVCVHMCVYA
jgi:hypothetical protein